jgi:hypothetical protein
LRGFGFWTVSFIGFSFVAGGWNNSGNSKKQKARVADAARAWGGV